MESNTDQRLLGLLQSLLDSPGLDLSQALTAAATHIAEWLDCDKVDAFLVDDARRTLVAIGTSQTPLGRKQKALGLDVLPIANGGRLVETFVTGNSYLTGRADLDEEELAGIVRELGVRSAINVPLPIANARRGVLSVVSQQPERFTQMDVRVLELISGWVGAVAHRAQLVEKLRTEEAARARTAAAEQIVTVLAHDIRNHLNPLAGRLQLLQLKLQQHDLPDPSSVDAALQAVRRLERLTSSWLDLSRLDQGLFELELAPVDLSELLNETAIGLSSPNAPVLIDGPPALVVLADAERLKQAFENVLANGLRHSPSGRPLRVTFERVSSVKRVHIVVSDEGPGVPPELLPHLFERFVSTRRSKGIGLGLYLAERIVAAHGGSLRAESVLGAGASFHFELPCEGPP
jgi:two-component system, OmpR family, sensor kinase